MHNIPMDSEILPILPLLYVVWSDGALSPAEAELVRSVGHRIGASDALLDPWLDPESPPSDASLRALGQAIAEARQRGDDPDDLVEMGLGLSEHLSKGRLSEAEADAVRHLGAQLGLRYARDAVGELDPPAPRPEGFSEMEPQSFDPAPLTAWLEGPHREDRDALRRLLSGPDFERAPDLSTEAQRARVLAWTHKVADLGVGRWGLESEAPHKAMPRIITAFEILTFFDISLAIKCGVQFGLFGGAVAALGTEHHHALLPSIASLELMGCFAMTERGHGSNVRALETTARFDPEAGAFIVNTPCDHARKEWIGNAADDGRMAVVFAQLEVGGEAHGVHAFLVPLRGGEGQLLPGVRIEDCGRKMGLNGVDNGMIWFEGVRIPRENLLNRFGDVDEEGRYSSPIQSASKRFFTMLGTLVGGRISIAAAGVGVAKSALAIAVRYGARRRQFGPKGGEEMRILDYPAHQRRLFPALAETYALNCAQRALVERFVERTEGDAREVEALAAGMKAYATHHATATVQSCREACGGQGYAWRNRFADLKADSDVFVTFEGDNTVLYQLVARSLLTDFQRQFADARIFGVVRYLLGRVAASTFDRLPFLSRTRDPGDYSDPEWHGALLKARTADLLDSVSKRIRRRLEADMPAFEAFNECQIHLIDLAQAYVEGFVHGHFAEAVAAYEGPQGAALQTLLRLQGLSRVYEDRAWFQENGYLDGEDTRAMRDRLTELCAALRPDAVTLVDAFDIPDACLGAPIAHGG